jgi:triacylglycerol lipase
MAHSLACHSEVCYRPPESIAPLARANGLVRIRQGDGWFSGEERDSAIDCVIAFRGTQPLSLDDWQADLAAIKHEGVHRGFKRRLAEIWPQITAGLPSNARRFWLTGHSLGGALAILAAVELVKQRDCMVSVYVYGTPRVGSAAFALEYRRLHLHNRTFRHRNQCDVVASIPPASLFRYRHVGREVYFDADGFAWYPASWWYRLRDAIDARLRDFGRFGTKGIKDHSMAEYRRLTRVRRTVGKSLRVKQ